ncbi:hypothetical protein NMY22_g16179 [Coprinellus aureogranulatus]|nr:hypothetical protein NMY22_g16179 [Coprinellus aureogranulatus]
MLAGFAFTLYSKPRHLRKSSGTYGDRPRGRPALKTGFRRRMRLGCMNLRQCHPLQAMTIRVEGCADAVAVFAGTSSLSYITILDVLTHVHRAPSFALRMSKSILATAEDASLLLAVELPAVPTRQGYHRWGTEEEKGRRDDQLESEKQEGRRWIGLLPSTTEQDVWILILR